METLNIARWEELLNQVRPVVERLLKDVGDTTAREELRAALEGAHAADVALVMEQLLPPEASLVLAQLQQSDPTEAAEVLDELSPSLSRYLTERDRTVNRLAITFS